MEILRQFPGDLIGLLLGYQPVPTAVRFLVVVFGPNLTYKILVTFLPKRALVEFITRLAHQLKYQSRTKTSFCRVWNYGSTTILRRCVICTAAVSWTFAGWTTDEDQYCWLHYVDTHTDQIKTTGEVATMCGTSRVPAAIKRNYDRLGFRRKITATRAKLYYIPPISKDIESYRRKRRPNKPEIELAAVGEHSHFHLIDQQFARTEA